MKLTNKHGLPDTFYQAVLNDKYSREGADYSATTLIDSPRKFHLTQRHWDEIEEDVSDRIWALLGKAVHSIMDFAKLENVFQEERIHTTILGKSISGASDLYEKDGTISDYKITSVWTKVYGSRVKDWTAQLNIYAYLFRSIGFPVTNLQTVPIYRDWSEKEMIRMPEKYPVANVEVFPLPLYSEKDQLEYITNRVRLMIDSEILHDDHLPPCTYEEMWEKETVYAVMKEGRKSAVKLFDSEDGAALFISGDKDKDKLSIKVRPGERTRCEKYCSANKFCNIYHEYIKTKPPKENILTSD